MCAIYGDGIVKARKCLRHFSLNDVQHQGRLLKVDKKCIKNNQLDATRNRVN